VGALAVGDCVVVVPSGAVGTIRYLGPVHYAKVCTKPYM
jgi:hypothetical protein